MSKDPIRAPVLIPDPGARLLGVTKATGALVRGACPVRTVLVWGSLLLVTWGNPQYVPGRVHDFALRGRVGDDIVAGGVERRGLRYTWLLLLLLLYI